MICQLPCLARVNHVADQYKNLEEVLEFLGLVVMVPQVLPKKNTGVYRSTMSGSTRARLRSLFHPYNLQLADFLGMDFDDWD